MQSYKKVETQVILALKKEAPKEGVDLYSEIARMVFGDNFTPDDRRYIKSRLFRWLYGGSDLPTKKLLITTRRLKRCK